MNKQWFNDRKEQLIGVLGLLVIVLGVSYLYRQYRPAPLTFPNPFERNLSASEKAAETEILKSFPKSFILDSQAIEIAASAKETKQGLEMAKSFLSQKPPDELLKLYGVSLKADKWTETGSIKPATGVMVTSYIKEFSRLLVSISNNPQGTNLILTYYPNLIRVSPSPTPTASPK